MSRDCRLAFTELDRSTPELIRRQHVWDPKTGTDRVLHEGPDLAGGDWGPDGRLAVMVTRDASPGVPAVTTSLIIVGADGTKMTLPAPAPDLGALYWGPSGSMAFVRVDAKATLFFNPDTDVRSELAGWWPVAWSPDGRQLLVSDADNHTELGIVNSSDLTAVERLGTSPVGVYGGVWLPAGATPEVGPKA